jgi:hypothetical protein
MTRLQVVDPVASWAVQRLVLAREKRHMDMPVMLECVGMLGGRSHRNTIMTRGYHHTLRT